MNKRQKEIAQIFLDDEKEVLKNLEKGFTRALADIKRNIRYLSTGSETASKAYQLEFQMMLKQQIKASVDLLHSESFSTISEYLNKCYEDGFIGSAYDMHGQGVSLILPINQQQVLKAVSRTADGYKLSDKLGGHMKTLKKQVQAEISRGFAQEMSYQEIARNISNYGQATYNRAANIAQTEGHRIQNEAKMDSMATAKDNGADIVKQWDSTLDGKTRKSHQELDGQIRELDEFFEVNGKKAMSPGGFGAPSEDCRCRCCLLQRTRWALDEDELATLKERAAYFGLDKTKDFDVFKQRYLKAVEQFTIPIVSIGGVDCTVTKGIFGFDDGYGGLLKTTNAVTYETPDGTQFVFPEKYIKKHQQMTPEQAIRCWYQVPVEIRIQAQKTIEFVDYYNPADSYWRKKYKNFPHSYATGGDKITFYRYDYPHQDDYVVRTYCHEAGHFIDTSIATQGNRFSSENLWIKAMNDDIIISGMKSPTKYGENSSAEDFAESVAEFVKDETGFASQFPNRAKIIKSIIKKVI